MFQISLYECLQIKVPAGIKFKSLYISAFSRVVYEVHIVIVEYSVATVMAYLRAE